MPEKKAPAPKEQPKTKPIDDVNEFIVKLDHPFKAEIESIREAILGASKEITEGIKWNAPSFHFKDWFATIHVRSRDCVHLILHLGARKKDQTNLESRIKDPGAHLHWLGKDRASVKFSDMKAFQAKKSALKIIVQQWIRLL